MSETLKSYFCCVSVRCRWWTSVSSTICDDLVDLRCVFQPCGVLDARGASYLSPFLLEGGREGESRAEVHEEEGGQTEQACAALSGPAHPSVRTIPKPLWQIRIESMHHIIVMIHCSPKSKCGLKALRPLNHHVCLSVCMLFKEESETDRGWMSLFGHNSASIKVSCVFSVCQKA